MSATTRAKANVHDRDSSGPTSGFHQVLILLALYLFGGGSAGNLVERVEQNVSDSERRATASAIAQDIEAELAQHRERLLQVRSEFYEVAQSYESSSEEIDAVLARGVEEAERVQEALVERRFRLREALSAGEWVLVCEGMQSRLLP